MCKIPTPSRTLRALLLGCVAVAWFALPVEPVSAHAQVLTISPPNGAVLASSPATVAVSFNEPVDASAKVQLLDATGKLVSATLTAAPTLDAFTLRPVKPLSKGLYALRFSVVSADGHVVSAASSFQVGSRPTGKQLPVVFTQGTSRESVVFSSDRTGPITAALPASATLLEFRHKRLSATLQVPVVAGKVSFVLPFSGQWSATLVLRPDKFTERRLMASFSLR